MNKRARLTRRILREHARDSAPHFTRVYGTRGGVEVWDFWACPRCASYNLIPLGVPRAYR